MDNTDNILFKADIARQKFNDKGLKYSDIKMSDFFRLVSFVCEEIENFKEEKGIHTMVISQRLKANNPVFNADENGNLKSAFIKVSSHYFEGREAISFYKNGVICFCRWASSTNEKPFINAFIKWVDTIKVKDML